MKSRALQIDPIKCDGCKECETACAAKHTGSRKIARKRIGILHSVPANASEKPTFFVPSTCQQCEEPPCMAICPKNAIRRDPQFNRVVLDTSVCVGCAMCVSACPTGSMAFAHDVGLPYKCELCDGEPECVRVCEKKALEYLPSYKLHQPRARQSALRHLRAVGSKITPNYNQDDKPEKE
jgi:carbon-monoxide dehydrogenase iron sulfur subunit